MSAWTAMALILWEVSNEEASWALGSDEESEV